jgi:hypothetical protein
VVPASEPPARVQHGSSRRVSAAGDYASPRPRPFWGTSDARTRPADPECEARSSRHGVRGGHRRPVRDVRDDRRVILLKTAASVFTHRGGCAPPKATIPGGAGGRSTVATGSRSARRRRRRPGRPTGHDDARRSRTSPAGISGPCVHGVRPQGTLAVGISWGKAVSPTGNGRTRLWVPASPIPVKASRPEDRGRASHAGGLRGTHWAPADVDGPGGTNPAVSSSDVRRPLRPSRTMV